MKAHIKKIKPNKKPSSDSKAIGIACVPTGDPRLV